MTIYSKKLNIKMKIFFLSSCCSHISFFLYPQKELRREGGSFSPSCATAKNNLRTSRTGSGEERKSVRPEQTEEEPACRLWAAM